mmetsp:Transcript_40316/g.93249  ORF Transcript_40316/g.93249 Transcript_40316/m.93249 type:complete len:360 (-) Transcript_40316:73-1152(-)
MAARLRARQGDGEARRRVLQARESGGRRHRRSAQRGRGGRLRGQGQAVVAGGQRVRARAERGPHVLLRRLRRHLHRGRCRDGEHPEDRGERRHHRTELRARGAGDLEGQEGREVHRPQGGRHLCATGHGVPHVRGPGLHAEAQRQDLRRQVLGEGGDEADGPPGAGQAGHDHGHDRHQVHAVELRRLLQGWHDDRRRCRPAEPCGLCEARRPEGVDMALALPPKGCRLEVQGRREEAGPCERPRSVHRGRHGQGRARAVGEELRCGPGALDGGREEDLPRGPRWCDHRLGRLLPLPRLHRPRLEAGRQVRDAARGLRGGSGGHRRLRRLRHGDGLHGPAPVPPLRRPRTPGRRRYVARP